MESGPELEVAVTVSNIQDNMEAGPTPVIASNENAAARTPLLNTAGPTISVAVTLFADLPVGLLAGLYIFSVYGSLIMGLVLLFLALAQPWARVSAATVKKLVWLDVALVHLALGLKMRLQGIA